MRNDDLGMKNAKWRKYTLEPRLGGRLQRIYGLAKKPVTLAEYIALGRELVMSQPEGRKFIEAVRSGKAVIGETVEERGYSIDKDGHRVNVMCAYDALHTAVIRGQGLIHAACPHCGERMEIRVEGSRVVNASPPSIVYWLGAPPEDAPGIPTCDHLHFFPSSEHLEAWLQTQRDELGVEMPVKEAAEYYAQVS